MRFFKRASSTKPLVNQGDENNINFLRLLFALMVIWSHSMVIVERPQGLAADLGVNGFFVLSGYLISQSWARKRDWRRFLLARVRRICPGWFVCILICTFIVAPLGSTDAGATLREALTHPARLAPALFLLPPSYPPTFQTLPLAGAVNPSLWTIPYEFRLYLLVPLGGILWAWLHQRLRRRSLRWLPVLLFVLIYALYVAQMKRSWAPPTLPTFPDSRLWLALFLRPSDWPRFATFFAAGAVLFVCRRHLRPAPIPTWVCLFVLLGIFWARAIFLLLPVLGSYALMSIALDRRWPLPRIPRDFDISYGTYLYAWPIQQLVVHFLGVGIGPYWVFGLSSMGALAAGTLSWMFVERPFLKSRRVVVNP